MEFSFVDSVSEIINKRLDTWRRRWDSIKSGLMNVGNRVTDFLETTLKKPTTKEDYIKIRKRYISKRMALLVVLIVLGIIYLTTTVFIPWANGNLWTAELTLNSEEYSSFTGKKVRVKDSFGTVIYSGEMESGVITGYGTQYDSLGRLVYEGEFSQGDYSGQGKLYNQSGVLIYKGEFTQSLYNGEGELYDENGNLIYKGAFVSGQRSGVGIEYDAATGQRIYQGDFLNDSREGNGIEYSSNGEYKIYEGVFFAGHYNGTGKLYEDGVLKYTGDFVNGLFEGQGVLYDIKTGKPIYKGGFVAGLYEGEGVVYNSENSSVIHKGNFMAGKRSGEGSSFDRLGSVSFSGEFRDDEINYLDYLGVELEKITEKFKKESYRSETNDNKLILTYLSLDMSMVFETNEEKGKYVCKKIIMGTKDEFLGLKSNSSKEEIIKVMGNPHSSIDFYFDKYYDAVFKQLSIDLSSSNKAPSDKFLMENYYVRFYYNSKRSEYLAVEVSLT